MCRKIKIYKEEKPKKGDSDYLIEFPKETCVISLEETIQLLFIMDKDIDDLKKILNVCRPWNYVRATVIEVEFNNNHREIFNKLLYHQQSIEGYRKIKNNLDVIDIPPLYFEEPELKGNKDIELIKNSIPLILPKRKIRISIDQKEIYGVFRKKGTLEILIREGWMRLEYYRRFKDGNNSKGKYTHTFKTVSEALPEINKIIGKMGYV